MAATSGVFFGVKLSSSNKVCKFNELAEEDDVDTIFELRQACLGVDAKMGRNMVQITTLNVDDEYTTHTLLSMRFGGTEMSPLFLTVRPPAKLELVKEQRLAPRTTSQIYDEYHLRSGPVHITGSLYFIDTSSDVDEEEVSATNEDQVKKGTKRPALSPASQLSVKSAEIIEVDTEEEEEEKELGKLYKDKSFRKKKLKAAEETDEEEVEEEDEDEDDEEYILDEDDDEEEEDMEIVVPKKTKKKQLGNTSSQTTQAKPQFKSPQPQKAPLKSILKRPKSPMSALKPRKGSETKKNRNKPSGPPSLDELKKKLSASPNLPKKLDKFNNYMSVTLKVSDPAVMKQMWEFVQNNN